MSFVMYMYCLLHADVLSCPDHVITAVVAQCRDSADDLFNGFQLKMTNFRTAELLPHELSARAL